jgi:TRAP-type mannitol/chloroaromatic compound transport system permease small subunit
LATLLDRLAWAICLVATAILTLVVLAVVVLRYGFGIGFIELQDSATYAFAVLVIFSVPVCLARDGHVRVEVLSERLSPEYRHAADVVALLAFLIPVFGVMLWAWWPQMTYAWSIREASLETGGLPGLYLVKTALPVAAALTIVQGLAAVLKGAVDDAA